MRNKKQWFVPWILPIILITLWEILSAVGVFSANTMPSPSAIVATIVTQWQSGELMQHILATLVRVILGFGVGLTLATLLGTLTGLFPGFKSFVDPMLQTLRCIPSMAWVPIFIMWLGIYESSKISLIALGIFFPVYLNLMSGIEQSSDKLKEVGYVFGLNKLQIIIQIIFPSMLPFYIVGIRNGLSNGWMFVVAAELMGASKGLGFLMMDGQTTGRTTIVFASVIVLAILGKTSDFILQKIQKYVVVHFGTI